jgi:hypothetical protein
VHEKLEQAVAGWQGHPVDFTGVPSHYQVPPRVRVAPQPMDQFRDLIDGAAVLVRCGEGAPLAAIDRAEFAGGIGPFIPDPHPVLLQVGDIRVAFDEPQQLVDDRAQVQFLGGQAGKSLAQVVADLPPEDRQGAGSGPVGTFLAVLQDIAHQIEVGFHG